MSRLDAGAMVYRLCGAIFSLIGAVFLTVGGFLFVNLDALARHGEGNVAMLPLVFGLLGAIMAAVGVFLLVLAGRGKRKAKRLMERGEWVTARITGFPIDYRVTINGMPSYRIQCSYRDPETGTVHLFESMCLRVDPAEYVTAETVRVYLDSRKGYRDYYVDALSVLPPIERH